MTDAQIASVLTQKQDQFMGFLRSRMGGDGAAAGDVLQSAYLKALQAAGTVESEENVVAWFWRILRNAMHDAGRAKATTSSAIDQLEAWAAADEPQEPELRNAICQCLAGVLDTVKPEQAALLRKVDLEGQSVAEVARAEGITANNAAVRLHRARAALRDRLRQTCGACARHACLDCSCKPAVR
jgi:RNA polymerase sigma factor (sigma-70 family)